MQHALRDELVAAREKFKAKAAAGLVTDVRTGEIVAMVSVPDYDPNNPREALDPTRINRLTTGVFEMGSTFKALTVAMALDSGKITLKSVVRCAPRRCTTASSPSTISTPRTACSRVPEIFTYSSNIGTARMALALGVEHHKAFLQASWASSTGCAPNCRKAPSRWCPSAGASSTPSPSRSATGFRSRRCRR